MHSKQLCVLFKSLGQAVAVANTQGQTLWASPLWYELLGKRAPKSFDPDCFDPDGAMGEAAAAECPSHDYPMLERCLTQNPKASSLLSFLCMNGTDYTQWQAQWGDATVEALVLQVDWPCGRGELHICPVEWDGQTAVAVIFHGEQARQAVEQKPQREYKFAPDPQPSAPLHQQSEPQAAPYVVLTAAENPPTQQAPDTEHDTECDIEVSAEHSAEHSTEHSAENSAEHSAELASTAKSGEVQQEIQRISALMSRMQYEAPAPRYPGWTPKKNNRAAEAISDATGQAEGEAASATAQRSLHILLAEGSDINKLVITEVLVRLGHTVESVSDGQKALEMLKKNDYDMAFLDCHMSGMDGCTVTRLMRIPGSGVRNPLVPVVAMSTLPLDQGGPKCTAAGMNDYLIKPLQQQELQRVLQRWADPLRSAMRSV